MLIVGFERLNTFKTKHAHSRSSLNSWEATVRTAQWQNIEGVRCDFKSVDYIPFRDLYCFDISGNQIRLLASISYKEGSVTVHEIFTHSRYDKWNKKR